MERIARIMEYFWLVLGVGSACWVAYLIHANGWHQSKLFLWFPLVCIAMFFYRRFMRRKMAEWAERKAREEQEGGKQ